RRGIRSKGLERDGPADERIDGDPAALLDEVSAFGRVAPKPAQALRRGALHGQAKTPIAPAERREQVEGAVEPLERRHSTNHPERKSRSRQLGAREDLGIDPVGDAQNLVTRPAESRGDPRTIKVADANYDIHSIDREGSRKLGLLFVSMQADHEPLSFTR